MSINFTGNPYPFHMIAIRVWNGIQWLNYDSDVNGNNARIDPAVNSWGTSQGNYIRVAAQIHNQGREYNTCGCRISINNETVATTPTQAIGNGVGFSIQTANHVAPAGNITIVIAIVGAGGGILRQCTIVLRNYSTTPNPENTTPNANPDDPVWTNAAPEHPTIDSNQLPDGTPREDNDQSGDPDYNSLLTWGLLGLGVGLIGLTAIVLLTRRKK